MKHPRTSIMGALALIFGILATQGGDAQFVLWCQRLAAVFTGLVGWFAHDGAVALDTPTVAKGSVKAMLGLALAGLLWCLLSGCTMVKQSVTTKGPDGIEQTTRATAFSLWDGQAVVEKMRVSNSPKGGQFIGVQGESTSETSSNTVKAIGDLRAILGK